MNFVFDIGNVLVSYKPTQFLEGLFRERALTEKLLSLIFLSPEWKNMDQGLLTHKEARGVFLQREPGLRDPICKVMDTLPDLFTPISETIELLPHIKKRGHSLYYLSNMHTEIRDYILREYDFFSLFDGGVFSCDVHMVKPDPVMYFKFLTKYNLAPCECVFFDDTADNATAAYSVGIKGVLFTGVNCVKPFLTGDSGP